VWINKACQTGDVCQLATLLLGMDGQQVVNKKSSIFRNDDHDRLCGHGKIRAGVAASDCVYMPKRECVK
jgi:hypothetical protein